MPLPSFLRRPARAARVRRPARRRRPARPRARPPWPPRPGPLCRSPPWPRLQTVQIEVPSALDSAPFDRAALGARSRRAGRSRSSARPKKARLEVPTPDGRLLVSRPEYGLITRLTPNKRGYPTSSTLVKGLRKPHGMAFDGSTLYVAESNRIDRYTYKDGKVGKRTTVLSGLPDSQEQGPQGRVRPRAQERRGRSGPRALRLGRLDRERLGLRPRPQARSARRSSRSRRASRHVHRVRPRRAERDRARRRAGRGAVDRGQQPRQRHVPVPPGLRRQRQRRLRQEDHRLRQRPPDRAAGQADAGPRPRLAVLQPEPRRRPRA